MTEPDDLNLMAYVDGELSPEDAADVEALIARSPEAAAKAARLAATRDRLQKAYAPIADEPAPERLKLLLNAAPRGAEIVDIAARSARWGAPQFGAMAASLVVGFGAATLLTARGDFIVERDGALYAAHALDKALARQLSGAEGPVAIGMTFKDKDGRWCRTFGADTIAGLACRAEEGWAVKTLTTPDAPSTDSGYRLAASALSDEILAAVEARIDGEPLDREEEAEVLARGWP
jgi:hypothetical protein